MGIIVPNINLLLSVPTLFPYIVAVLWQMLNKNITIHQECSIKVVQSLDIHTRFLAILTPEFRVCNRDLKMLRITLFANKTEL